VLELQQKEMILVSAEKGLDVGKEKHFRLEGMGVSGSSATLAATAMSSDPPPSYTWLRFWL